MRSYRVAIQTPGRRRETVVEASVLARDEAIVDMARQELGIEPDAFRWGAVL